MTTSLTASQVRTIQAELQELLEQLRSEAAEEMHQQTLSESKGHEVHDAGEEAEVEVETLINLQSLAHHNEEIVHCLEALQRIESGDYGFCIDCGEEIELNRLKASPTASRCIRCQTAAENDLQQSA